MKKNERNKLIIEKIEVGLKNSEIVKYIQEQTSYTITSSIVANVRQNHQIESKKTLKKDLDEDSLYYDKKIHSIERSLSRARSEVNYQRKLNNRLQKEENIKEELYEMIESSLKKNITPKKSMKIGKSRKKGKSVIFHITDLHIGKIGTSIPTEKYPITLVDRVNKLLQDILETMEDPDVSKIILAITGDIFELMSEDEKHVGMRRLMEIQSYVDNMEFAIDLTTNNLINPVLERAKLLKKMIEVEVLFIPGNHESVTKNKDHDTLGISGFQYSKSLELYYRLIKNVKINFLPYETRYTYKELPEADISISHGMKGENGVKAKDLRVKYKYTTDKFVIFLTGHRHEGKVEYYFNTVKIISPGIGGDDVYNESLGLYGHCGYTKITFKDNLPIVQVVLTD